MDKAKQVIENTIQGVNDVLQVCLRFNLFEFILL
jgi:hypothetical protein